MATGFGPVSLFFGFYSWLGGGINVGKSAIHELGGVGPNVGKVFGCNWEVEANPGIMSCNS